MPYCMACGRKAPAKELMRCDWCRKVYYCNQTCQKKVWKEHRTFCQPCWVCRERTVTPVQRSCSCRQKDGWAHVDCLVKLAIQKQKNDKFHWENCAKCRMKFTGALLQHMAEQKIAHDDEQEAMTATHSTSASRKERLDNLSGLAYAQLNNSQHEEALKTSQETIEICEELYGRACWNRDWETAYVNLASALHNLERGEEEQEIFEFVKRKLHENGLRSWKYYGLVSVSFNLSTLYLNEDQDHKALPILEDMLKHEHCLDEDMRIKVRTMLGELYFKCKDHRVARTLLEQAIEDSRRINGVEHVLTVEAKAKMKFVVKRSFNFGRTRGVENVPDGEIVQIKGYTEDGSFLVDLRWHNPKWKPGMTLQEFFADTSSITKHMTGHFGPHFALELYDSGRGHFVKTGLIVPVDQVIMDNDSNVVLHSLQGRKDLNGKTGVVQAFVAEEGRYRVKVSGEKELLGLKPKNILPAFMGCPKEKMIKLAKKLSH